MGTLKGVFEQGKHYMVSLDDFLYAPTGDTDEIIDTIDQPTNNCYVFKYDGPAYEPPPLLNVVDQTDYTLDTEGLWDPSVVELSISAASKILNDLFLALNTGAASTRIRVKVLTAELLGENPFASSAELGEVHLLYDYFSLYTTLNDTAFETSATMMIVKLTMNLLGVVGQGDYAPLVVTEVDGAPVYIGPEGVSAYKNLLTAANYKPEIVDAIIAIPIENTYNQYGEGYGLANDGKFWKDSTSAPSGILHPGILNELMCPYNVGDNVYLTKMTTGHLTDIGHTVNSDSQNIAQTTTALAFTGGEFFQVNNSPVTAFDQFGVTVDFGGDISLIQGELFPVKLVNTPDTDYNGCSPDYEQDLTGHCCIIRRGECMFSSKIFNAQNKGAKFVIIVNNVDGDAILNMAAGDNAADITIPSIFVSQNAGTPLIDFLIANPTNTCSVEYKSNLIAQPRQYNLPRHMPHRHLNLKSKRNNLKLKTGKLLVSK